MRCTLPVALLVTALSISTADAALRTRAMDGVYDEVAARNAALTGDLSKAEKRLKSTYEYVLKQLDKESRSRKQDVKRIALVANRLEKALAPEDALLGLCSDGVDAFLGEIDGCLTHNARGHAALGEENKYRKRSAKFLDKANEAVDAAQSQATLRKKLKLCKKADDFETQNRRFLDKGLDREDDLAPHQYAFLVRFRDGYTGTSTCIDAGCHASAGQDMLSTGHWNWRGTSTQIEGHEDHVHGKADLINNFCIAIASNEGRCTQCHVGYGWKDTTFDFADASRIDCLVCHDTTGTYKKDLTTAGNPMAGIDLTEVAMNVGVPGRGNCGACHFFAGGGDNVKHPDLPSTMAAPTRSQDVHMDADGLNFTCQRCHTTQDHGIAGMALHSQDEGRVECTDCHTGAVHSSSTLNTHTAVVACQTCHIPAFARSLPTKMEWWWGEAGQNISPIPTDQYGKPLYDKKKGSFVFEMNVRPTLRWFNGKWKRLVIGEDDTYTSLPAVLAEPVGARGEPGSKITPFKLMIGNQPADTVNRRMIVPHLFGTGPGPNPYWGKFDWALALAEGAAYAGQAYSGTYGFVDTEMYLTVNHEIAPKAEALPCTGCHDGGIDFTELGYPGDPWDQ